MPCTLNIVCVIYELHIPWCLVYSINCTFHDACVLYDQYMPWCLCTYSINCTYQYHFFCVLYELYIPWCLCTLWTVHTMVSVYSMNCSYHGVCVLYELVLCHVLTLSCILEQVSQEILKAGNVIIFTAILENHSICVKQNLDRTILYIERHPVLWKSLQRAGGGSNLLLQYVGECGRRGRGRKKLLLQ